MNGMDHGAAAAVAAMAGMNHGAKMAGMDHGSSHDSGAGQGGIVEVRHPYPEERGPGRSTC